jgi:hypothetical protein
MRNEKEITRQDGDSLKMNWTAWKDLRLWDSQFGSLKHLEYELSCTQGVRKSSENLFIASLFKKFICFYHLQVFINMKKDFHTVSAPNLDNGWALKNCGKSGRLKSSCAYIRQWVIWGKEISLLVRKLWKLFKEKFYWKMSSSRILLCVFCLAEKSPIEHVFKLLVDSC